MESYSSTVAHTWIQIILDPVWYLGLEITAVPEFQLFAAIALDLLWVARNRVVHDNFQATPLGVLHQILKCFKEHAAAWKNLPSLRQPISSSSFQPGKYHRMTFDVAVRPSFSMGSAVLFDSAGAVLKAWTARSLSVDPLVGEAEAALWP